MALHGTGHDYWNSQDLRLLEIACLTKTLTTYLINCCLSCWCLGISRKSATLVSIFVRQIPASAESQHSKISWLKLPWWHKQCVLCPAFFKHKIKLVNLVNIVYWRLLVIYLCGKVQLETQYLRRTTELSRGRHWFFPPPPPPPELCLSWIAA